MSRGKIAPDLSALMDYGGVPAHFDALNWRSAAAELRALLAVARAARTIAHNEACSRWSGEECDCLSAKVTQALARLDRVSGRVRRGSR